jgi:hypothetical protein
MSEINPIIKIKRGFGPPIENDQILLSRSELAFDEIANNLYIGKGLADGPVEGFPTQANELVVINSPKIFTKTIETPEENKNYILILQTFDYFKLNSISCYVENGSCDLSFYVGDFSSNDEIIENLTLSENLIGKIDNLFLSVEQNKILYIQIENVLAETENLTIQITYS